MISPCDLRATVFGAGQLPALPYRRTAGPEFDKSLRKFSGPSLVVRVTDEKIYKNLLQSLRQLAGSPEGEPLLGGFQAKVASILHSESQESKWFCHFEVLFRVPGVYVALIWARIELHYFSRLAGEIHVIEINPEGVWR